jgi:TatD DNase family protein
MLTDTHVHFSETLTSADATGLVGRAAAAGVGRLVAVGCEPDANAAALRAAALFPASVKAAVAYDRSLAGSDARVEDIRDLIAAAPRGHVVAIGELGLDFYYAPETADAQHALMEAQLTLARELRLPVIVHSRDADAATLALLEAHARRWPGDPGRIGVLHCFTGGAAFADRLLEIGFMISFSGIVTFRNADPLRAVARGIPADRLLLETDTPYLTPVPHRGRPNEPAYLPDIAAALARARGDTPEVIARVTTHNAERLFGFGSL